MADIKFDYPPILTKAAWDKNKGVMAKLAVGKTDVGAGLAAVELAFKTTEFADVKLFAGLDPLGFAAHAKAASEGLTAGVAAIGNKLGALKVIATAAHSDFAKNKLVPKASAAYVKSILDGIDPFKTALTNFIPLAKTKLLAEFRGRLHKCSGYTAILASADSAGPLGGKIIGLVKTVEANPKIATLHATFGGDGPHRMLTTIFKTWDQLALRDFPKLAASIYAGKAMTEFFPLPGLADMANETNSTASNKLQALVTGGQAENRVVTTYMLAYSASVMKANAMLKHVVDIAKALKAV